MRPLKKKYSVSLDEDLGDKIKLIAERNDRNFSQYINLVLKESLSDYMSEFFSGNPAEEMLIHGFRQLSQNDQREIQELIDFKIYNAERKKGSAKSQTL